MLSYSCCRPSHLHSSNSARGVASPFLWQTWSISYLICKSNLQTLGLGNESGKPFPMEVFTPIIYAYIISQASVILTRYKVLVKMYNFINRKRYILGHPLFWRIFKGYHTVNSVLLTYEVSCVSFHSYMNSTF